MAYDKNIDAINVDDIETQTLINMRASIKAKIEQELKKRNE